MGYSYNIAPGDLLWVRALYTGIQKFKAGTLDISAGYEQFGNLILPEFTVPGAHGPTIGLAYFRTPDNSGIRFPGGSYDPGELPISKIIGLGLNKIVDGVAIPETWLYAGNLNLTFASLFNATSVTALEQVLFRAADTIYYAADAAAPDRTTDVVHGWGGDDTIDIRGSGGVDYLYGDNGNDWININNFDASPALCNLWGYGGAGNDRIQADDKADHLFGGTGNDILLGYAGADEIYGGAGNDQLTNGVGAARLNGGDGTDSLYAGQGADILTGGGGTDLFIFAWNAGQGAYDSGLALAARDQISDFTHGVDHIRLLDLTLAPVTQIGHAAFTAANQVRWVTTGGNTTLFINTDADLAPEMAITLHDVTVFTAGDLVLT